MTREQSQYSLRKRFFSWVLESLNQPNPGAQGRRTIFQCVIGWSGVRHHSSLHSLVPRLTHPDCIFAAGLRHLLHLIGHRSSFARYCLPDAIVIEAFTGHCSVLSSQPLLNMGHMVIVFREPLSKHQWNWEKLGWLYRIDHLVTSGYIFAFCPPSQEFQPHSSPPGPLGTNLLILFFQCSQPAGWLFCHCPWVSVEWYFRQSCPNKVNKLMNLKFLENFISALSFKLPLNGAVAQWLFVYFPCAQDADLPVNQTWLGTP